MIVACIVVGSIALALGLAIFHGAPAARWRSRTVRPRVLLRALLPTRLVRSASGRADIGFMLFSLLLAGMTMGWALVSSRYFQTASYAALGRWLPVPPPTTLPIWVCGKIATVALFLSYEFAYWVNHWLSHRVPALWAFHKVHHSATSLSPLTNFRVHPVDTIVFYNMAAAATGFAAALVDFGLGRQTDPISAGGANLLVFLSSTVLTNLQHTQLWISLPGRWGRAILSPAHHQIHHSTDPRHHNRNFGSTLALFDRAFGTLHLPAARRERLRFGVDDLGYDPHGVRGAVLMPFVDAARTATRSPTERERAATITAALGE